MKNQMDRNLQHEKFSNDSRYLKSNLLKPPKWKHSFWFQESTHFNQLHRQNRMWWKLRRPTCMELDQNSTPEEFNTTINKPKSHKTGTIHLSVELLKHTSSNLLKHVIFQLILQTWESTQIPDSFLQLIMRSIFKKGDKRICKNQKESLWCLIFVNCSHSCSQKVPINTVKI